MKSALCAMATVVLGSSTGLADGDGATGQRVSRAGVLAATVAAAILVNSATWTAALAQEPAPVPQQRDEAPIGNQQPRMQDLPPGVVQDETKMEPELDAIDKELERLENRICRGC